MGKASRQSNREFRAAKDMVSRAVEIESQYQYVRTAMSHLCAETQEMLDHPERVQEICKNSAWFDHDSSMDREKLQRSLASSAAMQALFTQWLSGPQVVIDLDNELFNCLMETECPTEVPSGVFDNLPYDLFVVTGLHLDRVMPDGTTINPYTSVLYKRQGSAALFVASCEPEEGHSPFVQWWVDLDKESVSLGTTVWRNPLEGGEEFERPELDAHDVASLEAVVSRILLYLASPDPDMEQATPEKYRRIEGRRGAGTLPDTYRVGWNVGAALRRAREADRAEYEATGKRVRPHLRKAHWHLYWTGPNRDVPRVRWLSPVAVNKDLGDPVKTVRPVA